MPSVYPRAWTIPTRKASRDREAELTPQEIVAELDKYIIGQNAAKKAVAIALRNRYRRRTRRRPTLADEITPKNILMIGPTGVGKTEISRRLAKLTSSPFLKIEASKFTEVGYVGRDVESIVRDLVRIGVDMVRQEKIEEIRDKAEPERRGKAPRPARPAAAPARGRAARGGVPEPLRDPGKAPPPAARRAARGPHRRDRGQGAARPPPSRSSPTRGSRRSASRSRRSCPASWAARPRSARSRSTRPGNILLDEEQNRLIDMDQVVPAGHRAGRALRASSSSTSWTRSPAAKAGHGPEVSREGVQRDLLPIVEGTTVNTRYGLVKTDHVLFIGAGAFNVAKPADLIPELQGRFPIRVELDLAQQGRFRPHPDRAGERPAQAVRGPAGHRGRRGRVHRRRHRRDRPDRRGGQPRSRGHRRPPPAHDHGKGHGGDLLPGAGHQARSNSSSTGPTSRPSSRTSSRTRTCGGSSCDGRGPAPPPLALLGLLAAACGKKGTIRPPLVLVPQPVETFRAVPAGWPHRPAMVEPDGLHRRTPSTEIAGVEIWLEADRAASIPAGADLLKFLSADEIGEARSRRTGPPGRRDPALYPFDPGREGPVRKTRCSPSPCAFGTREGSRWSEFSPDRSDDVRPGSRPAA